MKTIEAPEGLGNPRMGWGSDVMAEMLRRLDVPYVAINPGASFRGLHDSIVNYLGNRGPQMLLCLHEDHAVSIAHGYAKATGRMMGCVLHSNVGLMHGLMGIFNAWCDRAPILVMGATGPVDAKDRRPWIDWIHTAKDQGALLRDYVKYDDEPRSAEAVVETMLRAAMLARTQPNGPVYVCFEAGLQEQELKAPPAIPDIARYAPAPPPSASPDETARIAELLLGAERPVVLAGRVSRSQEDWDRRVRLCEALGAQVLTDLKNAAAFPTDHPLHAAPPASFLAPEAKPVVKAADVILALDWVDVGGTFQQALGRKDAVTAKVIHCSLDSYLHNGWSSDHFSLPPADLNVLADPDALVAQLLPLVEAGAAKRAPQAPAPAAKPTEARDAAGSIRPADIGLSLARIRNGRPFTLSKVSLGWPGSAYHFSGPLDYLGSEGGAGLGSGPGAAVGAALALKDEGRITIAVLGDGDFMQGGTALWTAAHYNIPILFVISNNRSNFNDEVHQESIAKTRSRPVENKWIGMRIDEPALDMVGFARSQGVEAHGPVERYGDLDAALEKGIAAIAAGKPYLIDVRVEPGYSAPLVVRSSGELSTGA